MESKYVLMADADPTDEQLAQLMDEVLEDVKSRAALAESKFKQRLMEQIKIAEDHYKK